MRSSLFFLVLFAAVVCQTGCTAQKSPEPKVTLEEVEVKDVEVDHADEPVLEFESKESK